MLPAGRAYGPMSQWRTIGKCVYCGSTNDLRKEHVLPYGLGGDILLLKATCKSCAAVTSAIEGRLLRGHWRAYRKLLGLTTRSKYPTHYPVKVKTAEAKSAPGLVASDQYPVLIVLDFDPPSILSGRVRTELPFATKAFMKLIAPMPSTVLVDGQARQLGPREQIEFPIEFDAADFVRLLAKVAHGYAIYRRGTAACSEYFLPKYILGTGEGLLTYVGRSSSAIIVDRLPDTGLHAMLDTVHDGYLSVYVQLFRDEGDLPPIYEVVVGKLPSKAIT